MRCFKGPVAQKNGMAPSLAFIYIHHSQAALKLCILSSSCDSFCDFLGVSRNRRMSNDMRMPCDKMNTSQNLPRKPMGKRVLFYLPRCSHLMMRGKPRNQNLACHYTHMICNKRGDQLLKGAQQKSRQKSCVPS